MLGKKIYTKQAPEPIGPYSQAVEANGFIFTSGQIAINPETGNLLTGNAAEQVRLVIQNLKSVLESGGSSLNNVVKTTIFLKDMEDFGAVNEVYAEFFGEGLPARSTVEVSRLPKDVLVEIDCIAAKR